MKAAIETFGLTRYFDTHRVVNQLDFQVPIGKVTALLGLNGAGKTTTIRMMMGLLDPTRGRCETLGTDSRVLTPAMLSRIGYMVEGHYLSPWMRVSQMEKFSAAGHRCWDAGRYRSMVEHFGISAKQRIGSLSRGQRAGVSLASVLAADPELLILDDPALGLDPVSRRAMNETLVDFAAGETAEGTPRTVLLSTHLMDDVERIADEIAVMVAGRLLVHTTLDDFLQRVQRFAFVPDSKLLHTEVSSRLRPAIPGLVELRWVSGQCVVCVADASDEVHETLRQVATGSVESLPTSLNDLVIAYLTTQRSDSFSTVNSNSASSTAVSS